MKFKGYAFLLTLLVMLAGNTVWAQEPNAADDFFRQSGKIYVVVAILSVIFLGVLVYLISIDRRVRKIEKEKGANKH